MLRENIDRELRSIDRSKDFTGEPGCPPSEKVRMTAKPPPENFAAPIAVWRSRPKRENHYPRALTTVMGNTQLKPGWPSMDPLMMQIPEMTHRTTSTLVVAGNLRTRVTENVRLTRVDQPFVVKREFSSSAINHDERTTEPRVDFRDFAANRPWRKSQFETRSASAAGFPHSYPTRN